MKYLTTYKEGLLLGSGSLVTNFGSDLVTTLSQIGEMLADYSAFALAAIAILRFLFPGNSKKSKDKPEK